jgi:hypothetical protein
VPVDGVIPPDMSIFILLYQPFPVPKATHVVIGNVALDAPTKFDPAILNIVSCARFSASRVHPVLFACISTLILEFILALLFSKFTTGDNTVVHHTTVNACNDINILDDQIDVLSNTTPHLVPTPQHVSKNNDKYLT